MANQRFRFPCAGASSGYGMESYSTANFQPRYNMYNMRPRGPPPWLNPGPRWQPPLNRGPAPPAVRGRGQGHSHGQGWRSGANEGQSKDQEQLVEDKAEKEEEKEEEEEEEDDDDEGDDDWSHCAPCNKDFTDYAAFFRHLRGVSHQTNVDAYKKIKRQESVSKVKRQEPQSTGPKTPQKNTDATDISTATPCPSSATNDSKTAENKEQEMETDENKTTEIQQQEKKPNDSKTTEISKAAKTQEQEEQGDQGEEEDEEDDEDWSYCKPCDRHFQSLQNYTSHARGILHASNQLEYEKQQASTEAALSSRGPGCTQPRKPASVSSTYRCELCAIDFQSQSQLDQHYQSRLHVTKMMNQQVQRQSQEQGQEMSQLQGWDQSQGQSQLQGGDQSQGQSQLQGWDQSQGQSQLQGWDQSQGQSQLQGGDQSQGQSQLQGWDQSQGQSQLQGWDQSQGQSQLQSWDRSHGQGQGQGWDQSQGQSQLQSGDQGQGQEQLQGWDQSQGQSQLQGWDQSQGQSQLQGWDQGQGQSQLQGQSWDQSQGQSQMQWQSWDQSQGQSQHQSQQQSGQQKTETSDKTWEIVELPESFGAASMFACKVCDVCCTSELTLASHLNGQKHAKVNSKKLLVYAKLVLRKKKQAEALKSMKDGETPTIVGSVGSKKKLTRNQLFIQSELDKCDQPLIGLDYVIEYRKNDCTQEPRYVCGLCHSTADPRMIIIHVTGVKHRLRYMKYHWPRRYSSLRPIKKKSVVVEQCAEHAMEIQRWEGRQKPRLKLEIDPFAISAGAESTDNFADVYVEGAGPRRALPGTCEVQNVSGYQQEKASTSDDEDLGDLWTPEPADMYSQHQGPQDYDPPPPIPSSHPSRGHPSRGPIGPPPHPPPPPHYPHPRHRFPPSCGPMGPPPPRPPRPPRYPLPGHPFPPPQEPVGPPLPPPHPPSPPPPPPPHYPLPHDSFETLPPRDRGPVGAPPVPPRPVQVIDYGHQVNEPTHSVSQQSEPKQLESQQPVRESQLEGAVLAAVKLLSQQAAVAGANSPALAALMTSLTSQASAPAPGQNQPSAFAAALSELMRVQAERKKAETANQLSNVLTSAVMKSVKTTPPVTHQLTEQTLLVGQKTQHEPTASLQIPASPVVQRIQQLTNLSLTLEKASSVQPTSVGQVGNVQPNVQPTSFGQVGNVQPTLVGQVGNVQPNVQPTSVGQVGNVQPTLVGQVSILQPNIQPTSVGKASIVQPNVQPTSVVKVSNVQPFSAYRPVAAQPQPSQPPGSGLEGLLSQLKPDTMARISQLLDDIQTLKTTNKPGTSPAPASTKVVPIVASAQSFAAKPTSSARPNLLSTPQTGVMRTSQQKYTAVHSSTETYRQQSAASLSLNHQKVANIKRTLAAPIPQANIPQKPAAMGYQVAPKQSVSKQNIQSEQKLVNTKRTTAAPILYANITGTQKLPAIGHRVAQKQSVTKQDNVNSYKRKSSSDLRLAEVKRKTPAPAVGSAQVQQAVAKQASPVLDMFAPDTTSTKTVSGSSETKAAAAAPKQTVAAVAPKQTVAAAAPKQTVAATAPKQTVAAAAFKQKS